MTELRKALRSADICGRVLFDEPMAAHTAYRVGGPADAYVEAVRITDLEAASAVSKELRVPLFVLGEGANILVADRGVRGVVVDMAAFDYCIARGTDVIAGAGTPMSRASELASAHGLSGLEFIYGMPGSVGGSVWMNARCYGRSVADVLSEVTVLESAGRIRTIAARPEDFSYKRSPFQTTGATVLEAVFALRSGTQEEIGSEMREHLEDRKKKGHFSAPSAGSVFKNNRELGAPTGKILDELGLRGYRVGGAMISEHHANIIVNADGATAADILSVMEHAERTALTARGIRLEREVLLVGDWRKEGVHGG